MWLCLPLYQPTFLNIFRYCVFRRPQVISKHGNTLTKKFYGGVSRGQWWGRGDRLKLIMSLLIQLCSYRGQYPRILACLIDGAANWAPSLRCSALSSRGRGFADQRRRRNRGGSTNPCKV